MNPYNASALKEKFGEELYTEAASLCQRGGVREEMSAPGAAVYTVLTPRPQRITFHAHGEPRCTCEAFTKGNNCIHIAAAALAALQSGAIERLTRIRAMQAAPELMAAMDSALPEDGNVRMEVTLYASGGSEGKAPALRIGLRMGDERLYMVRSIPQLIDALDNQTPMLFGKGFSFRPEWMRLAPENMRIIAILRALRAAQGDAGTMPKGAEARLMYLPDSFAEAVLDALEDLPFRLETQEGKCESRRVQQGRLQLGFRVTGDLRGVMVTGSMTHDVRPLTSSYAYVTSGSTVLKLPQAQRSLVRTLLTNRVGGRSCYMYAVREIPQVVGELIPFLKMQGAVEIDADFARLLEQRPLSARIFLDRDGRDVVAQTEFVYGQRVIDPFHEAPPPETLQKGEKLLLRDAQGERGILDALGSAGFHVSKGRVYLSGQEAIYRFISEGVYALKEKCDVFLSQDFRKMTPRRPVLQGKIRLNGGRVELTLTDQGERVEELYGLMEALARRRAYFRLKDGRFLDLSGMEEWQETAVAVTEAVQTEGAKKVDDEGTASIGASRMVYLTALLDSAHLPVEVDEEIRSVTRALVSPEEMKVEMPNGLGLRPYQERGYRWLYTLDSLRMGGILADDMGLGKTVQMIALLRTLKKEGRVSLVVAPTSLTYNWLSEIGRFAPELSAMVLSGTGAQRASQIEHVRRAGDVDVLITSYPLIRRDVELMREIPFRLAILDEAQQIKNAGSVGAMAVKRLSAETHFALTGTPVENSTGELWSIFDFVLPGYLGSYPAFLRRYQDGMDTDDLRRRIRPFLLRRLKGDVLTELPDKNETVLTAQMTLEQKRVYDAAMERLRIRVNRVMDEKGLGRGRAEVLSCMTELRQICCHPQLVLEDYAGSSGKMELLLDVLPGALEQGRRILLFSQFTGMLKILRSRLENEGISCLYLDGETPSHSRAEMAEKFNAGEGQVFLISLKAGGTGLNLIGADMVIHYDPWWNPAAEDQATDRAHRIGQTRKVDVIRLVTHASIEEQVVALSARKRALFDQLITPGEELVTAMTEADIRALFA